MSSTAHEDQFGDPTPEEDEAFEAMERASSPVITDSSAAAPQPPATTVPSDAGLAPLDVLRSVWNAMENSGDGDDLLSRLEHMRGSIEVALLDSYRPAPAAATAAPSDEEALRDLIGLVKAYGDQLYCKASAQSPVDQKSWSASAEGVLSNIIARVRALLSRYEQAQPDTIPRHVARTLANAIYEAAQRAGIANGDHSSLSVAQCLHLLDCMAPARQPTSGADGLPDVAAQAPAAVPDDVPRFILNQDLYGLLTDIQNGIDSPATCSTANRLIRMLDKVQAALTTQGASHVD